jgi:hypothetical protein
MKLTHRFLSTVSFLKKTDQTTQEHFPKEGEGFTDSEAFLIKQKIEQRKRKQKKIKTIMYVLSFSVVTLAVFGGYSQYKLYSLKKEELGVSGTITPKTGEEVVLALSRHILVPQGVPQVAIVQDASKLRETQAFFKDVENDDVVVVYDTSIYIYRPSKDIVVNAGDISGIGQVNP